MPRIRTAIALCWLLMQPIVFYWKPLIRRTSYLPYDLPGFHTPLAAGVVEALQQRRLPLWDPYSYGGYPLHADLQAQILYPPVWPAYFKSAFSREYTLFYWLEWEAVLHVALAGVFTWWLLRRCGCSRASALYGATVYQLGCFFSVQIQHLGAVCGAAWMPLAWLAVVELARGFSKRWFAALAAALAMTFLAGFSAITLIVYGSALLVAVAFWLSGRARVALPLWTALAMVASFALVLGQLVPTTIWSAHSAAGRRWMWSNGGGVAPKALISMVFPDWFHVFKPERYTEHYNSAFMYLYNGQAAVWLLVVAPFLRTKVPARLFAALTVVFAVVMLGNATPVYRFFFHLLPRAVRGATYIEYGPSAFSLAIAAAAALALEHLTRGRRVWIALAIAMATSTELTLIASNSNMNSTRGDWRLVDSPRRYFEREPVLWQLKAWQYATIPPLRSDTMQHEYRFVTVAPVVRLPTLNGDNPFAPIRMLDYRKVFSEGNYWERFYNIRDPASPLIDAGNVGFLLHMGDVDVGRLQQSGWDPIPWELPFPMFVFRNREAMPRYYLVSHVRRAGTAAEARELLQTADPRREAIVEGAPAWHGAPEKALPAVKVISYRPDRVELQTTAPDTAYLVIAESWAPGWEAWVDGRRAGLYPTNLAFQGLPLAAGEHRLTIAYVPTAAYAALGLSVLAWIGMAVWVWKPAASATAVVT